MNDLHQQLRELIDIQDVDALKQFLQENPTLDLNRITLSGASALWYAVFPEDNKPISNEICIALLHSNRLDLSQRYGELRLSSYLFNELVPGEQGERVFPQWYAHVSIHEEQFERLEVEENLNNNERLRQFIADEQNTHDSAIMEAIDESVVRLYQRYGQKMAQPHTLKEVLKEFNSLLKTQSIKVSSGVRSNAKSALKRIIRDQETRRTYHLAQDKDLSLKLDEVLALVYLALCDKDPTHFVLDVEMSENEILNRKIRLIQQLAQTEVEYPTGPACWMGTRNQTVATLDMTHLDVVISQRQPLTSEILEMRFDAFSIDSLKKLEKTNPDFFKKYTYYRVFQNTLLGFRGDETEIPTEITDWEAEKVKLFFDTLNQENNNLQPTLQMATETLEAVRKARDYLNVNAFSLLEELQYFASWLNPDHPFHALAGSFKAIFDSESSLEEQLAQLKQNTSAQTHYETLHNFLTIKRKVVYNNTISVRKKNGSIEQRTIVGERDIYPKKLLEAIDYFIQFTRLITRKPESGSSSQKAELSALYQPIWIISLAEIVKERREKPSPELIHQIVCELFILQFPEMQKWFSSMPERLQMQFITQLFEQDKSTLNKESIAEESLAFAIRTGHFKGLTINKGVIIRDKDFRGINLQTVDLTQISFENCNLNLTGIERNPSASIVPILDKNSLNLNIAFEQQPSAELVRWFISFIGQKPQVISILVKAFEERIIATEDIVHALEKLHQFKKECLKSSNVLFTALRSQDAYNFLLPTLAQNEGFDTKVIWQNIVFIIDTQAFDIYKKLCIFDNEETMRLAFENFSPPECSWDDLKWNNVLTDLSRCKASVSELSTRLTRLNNFYQKVTGSEKPVWELLKNLTGGERFLDACYLTFPDFFISLILKPSDTNFYFSGRCYAFFKYLPPNEFKSFFSSLDEDGINDLLEEIIEGTSSWVPVLLLDGQKMAIILPGLLSAYSLELSPQLVRQLKNNELFKSLLPHETLKLTLEKLTQIYGHAVTLCAEGENEKGALLIEFVKAQLVYLNGDLNEPMPFKDFSQAEHRILNEHSNLRRIIHFFNPSIPTTKGQQLIESYKNELKQSGFVINQEPSMTLANIH